MKEKINPKNIVLAYFISLRKNLSGINEVFIGKRIVNEYNINLEELANISGSDLSKFKMKDEGSLTNIDENGTVKVTGYETSTSSSSVTNVYQNQKYHRIQLLTKLDSLLLIFREDIKSFFVEEPK